MDTPQYVVHPGEESQENVSIVFKPVDNTQFTRNPYEASHNTEQIVLLKADQRPITVYEQGQANQLQTSNQINASNQIQTSQIAQSMAPTTLIAAVTNQVHSPVEINIVDHFKKEDTLRDYTVYSIKGSDSQGYIEVARRYNDFFLIRKMLVMKWPGCYVPAIPGKDILKSMNAQFIAERKFSLNLFLRKVADLPHLHYSPEYQVFLRYLGGPFEQALKGYQRVDFDEMIQRYALTFQELALIQQTSEAPLIASRFRSFLYKIIARLRILGQTSREVAKAKRKYYEGMAAFQAHIAYEYERDVIGEYQNYVNLKNVFCEPNNTKLEGTVAKLRGAMDNQSVEYFDAWIAEEEVDARTLLEAIDQREKYEGYKRSTYARQQQLSSDLRDITAGQFNWKAAFSSRPKDQHIQELNTKIATCSREIEQLNTLIDMITLVISYIEIDKFKKNKSEKFYKIVGMAAQNEIDNLSQASDYWTQILTKNGI